MADPLTIAMVASSAASAVGAIQQGQAQKAQAEARAQANEYNAQVREIQAGVEREQAGARESQQRREARQLLGAQRAGISQAGIGLMGSAIDVEEQSATRAELDALTIRYEGETRAVGLLNDAELEEYNAEANREAGSNAMKGAYLSAGASILSGASDYQYAKAQGLLGGG